MKYLQDAPDFEELRVRVMAAAGTLLAGWYLGHELLPEHSAPRQVIVTLLFWGALYSWLVAGNLAAKLKDERARFKGILMYLNMTTDHAESVRRTAEECYNILSAPALPASVKDHDPQS